MKPKKKKQTTPKAITPPKPPEFKFEQIFDIVEDINKNKQTIYRLRFKSDSTLLHNGMANKLENVKGVGKRWINRNLSACADMIFEMDVLQEPKKPREGVIYSDGIHVVSDLSIDHLHEQMKLIDIKRCWYHSSSRFKHYDIPKRRRKTFFEKYPHIKQVTPVEIVNICKKVMDYERIIHS